MFANHEEKWKKNQQNSLGPKYCPKVRMGNWNEELILQEEKLKYFLGKKERGQLMVQKTRTTFSNLLKELTLFLPADHLGFGHRCQVVAPALCHPRAPQGLVLAGVTGTQEVDTCQHFLDGSLVSASPSTLPCVRNCFIICSPDGKCRDGEKLTYGENFALATVESLHGQPLYIECEVPHLHSVLGRSKRPLLRLTSYKNIYSLWRTVPLDHAIREDLWGLPVSANIPLVLNHVASNKNLSLEHDCWFTTYFGPECEVTVNTVLNVYRRETAKNIWALVTNRPKQEHW